MAYMSQENKKGKEPTIKAICKTYGIKASLAVDNHSTLVLNVKSGSIDFIGNYNKVAKENYRGVWEFSPATDEIDVNVYHYHNHFNGKAKQFLTDVITAMNVGNHNNSDLMSDYFDVGWYIDVRIGRWNKPYILTK